MENNTENFISNEGMDGAMPTPEASVDKKILHKAIIASAIGNGTEWFDYGVYAVTAIYIMENFFPGKGGMILTFATFALSFLVRPFGAIIWGALGDKIGRKRVLATTVIMMAGATTLIGVIPNRESIGIAAPILLILCRMIQGFSTGGEYGGAATFMAEYAPSKKRGFYGSFLEVATVSGYILGTVIVLLLINILGHDAMLNWGWRIPFFVAAPLGLIGVYLRTRLEDTPLFRELEEKEKAAASEKRRGVWKELFTHYWKNMIILGGLIIALNVANYTILSYMPTYLQDTLGMSANTALVIFLIGQLVMAASLPFFGATSDRIGRRPILLISCIGLLALALPMFMLMPMGFGWAIVGFVVLGLLFAPQLAVISASYPAFFPTHIRYFGLALTYSVFTSAFGGTTSMVNIWLQEKTGSNLVPPVYMMVTAAIGIIAIIFMKETKGLSLRTKSVSSVAVGERIKAPGE